MIEQVWCVVDAVRVQGVVQTTFPVVEVAADLTYDLTVNARRGTFPTTDVLPVGNRPAGNIRVGSVGWGFSAFIVGEQLQADIPEHRNAVPCP